MRRLLPDACAKIEHEVWAVETLISVKGSSKFSKIVPATVGSRAPWVTIDSPPSSSPSWISAGICRNNLIALISPRQCATHYKPSINTCLFHLPYKIAHHCHATNTCRSTAAPLELTLRAYSINMLLLYSRSWTWCSPVMRASFRVHLSPHSQRNNRSS